jgi:hypothetical protein
LTIVETGDWDGAGVGGLVGKFVGAGVGAFVGNLLGEGVGLPVVGDDVGLPVVGGFVGKLVGKGVGGPVVGDGVGDGEGGGVGALVGGTPGTHSPKVQVSKPLEMSLSSQSASIKQAGGGGVRSAVYVTFPLNMRAL